MRRMQEKLSLHETAVTWGIMPARRTVASAKSINSWLWTPRRALSRLYNGHLPKKRNSDHSFKFFTSRNLVSLVTPEGLTNTWNNHYSPVRFLCNGDAVQLSWPDNAEEEATSVHQQVTGLNQRQRCLCLCGNVLFGCSFGSWLTISSLRLIFQISMLWGTEAQKNASVQARNQCKDIGC